MSSPPPSSQGRSSDDPSCERGHASGWTPRLPVLLYEQRSSAVGHRRHDLARQSENRGLVRRAMPDDERPTAFGQLVQHTAERCAEDRRILLPQLRIGRAKRLQLAAARLLVGAPPPVLDLRTQTALDDSAARNALPERARKAGERLRGAVRAARDQHVVAAAKRRTERERRLDPVAREHVALAVGMAPELDLLGHSSSPRIA